MNWEKEFQRWLKSPNLDKDTRAALEAISGDQAILEDSFYKNLAFGTGGMRGEIGPGPNRMNRYTVRKASEGLARYIAQQGKEAVRRGVVIAYDSRHKSREFAKETAQTLGIHGIRTYLFQDLRPTPELSFAIRYLNAFSGVVITASHNPPQYNGFKVYGEDGGQLTPNTAGDVTQKVNEVQNELMIKIANKTELAKKGLLIEIGGQIDRAYNQKLQTISCNREALQEMAGQLNIVYTPLHGTGNHPVREGLKSFGFQHVTVVEEQEAPDPEFPTVSSPNPEERESFKLAFVYGKKVDADLLLTTDPDADRIGVAVKDHEGEYVILTGNQIGAVLLYYLLSQKKTLGQLPKNGVVLKTIVTSELGRKIAAAFDVETVDTLTGFKYIGEKIKEYHHSNEYSFLFGYEESQGYLIGDFVRDKDAVQACLFATEAAAYYKRQRQSLVAVLQGLFQTYGWHEEVLCSVTLKGKQGAEKIKNLMSFFREYPLLEIVGRQVMMIEDYQKKERKHLQDGTVERLYLPQENVLKYWLDGEAWFCLRPSGTEPKLKLYFAVCESSREASEQLVERLKARVTDKVNQILDSTL